MRLLAMLGLCLASKIVSKAPLLRYLSKWIMIGGLGLIALAYVLNITASIIPVEECAASGGAPPGPCTEQDRQNNIVKIQIREIFGPMIWLGIAIASIAFIAWVNVRRW